jgi:hypothetical protein
MRLRRLTFFVATLSLAASCSSKDAASDGSRSGAASDDSTESESPIVWFDGTAPLLLVPAHSNDRALVVLADSLAEDPEDGALEQSGSLIRLDGSASTVRVSLSSGSEGCVDAALEPAPSTSWGIGFVGTAPVPVKVDSLKNISRGDSTALAPIVFRLASAVPNAPGGRFSGLPFTLVDLWRIRMADGSVVVVATTKRQINQEDSPLEERTLLIAERDSSSADYTLVHSARSTGPEETVEGSELLAVVGFPGKSETQLIFSHDFGDQTSYSIIERLSRGTWKSRWASRRFSC